MRAKASAAPNGDEPEVEMRPDGWERFEAAVDAAVRAPPIRRSGRKSYSGDVNISLSCCSDEFVSLLDELSYNLPALSEGAEDFVHREFGVCDVANELIIIDVYSGAALANEVIVRLQPSDRLRRLVSAARARYFD